MRDTFVTPVIHEGLAVWVVPFLRTRNIVVRASTTRMPSDLDGFKAAADPAISDVHARNSTAATPYDTLDARLAPTGPYVGIQKALRSTLRTSEPA